MALNMKKELQSVIKSLETLSKKVEMMVAAVTAPEKPKSKVAEAKSKVAKAKSAKKITAKKPSAKKTEKLSAPEIVLGIITGSTKDVNIAELKEKTGFKAQKLHNVISRLKKQGKIKSAGKGVYVKG